MFFEISRFLDYFQSMKAIKKTNKPYLYVSSIAQSAELQCANLQAMVLKPECVGITWRAC